MYAIIETGGKQYRVSVGQQIEVEKLPAAVGQTVEIGNVLLVSDNGDVEVGTPRLEGARVRATVLEQGRARKVIVFKFRRGNRYKRKRGHRQDYTKLRIEQILRKGEKIQDPEPQAVAEAPRAAAARKRRAKVDRVPVALEELGLPVRVTNVLKGAGIESVNDFLSSDEESLLSIRGFGAKSLEQVRAVLKGKGLVEG